MAKRFLMWLLATFVGAMLLCTFLSIKAALILAALCVIVLVLTLFLRFKLKVTVISCLISAVLSIGLFLWTVSPVLRLEQQLLNQECTVEGTVVEIGSNSAKTLDRYSLRLTKVNGQAVKALRPFHVYLYVEPEQPCTVGSTVGGTVQFFDRSIEYGAGREDNVYLSAFAESDALTLIAPAATDWRAALNDFRLTVQNRIAFGSEKTQGFLRSVCFGDKSNLDPALAVSLRRDGLSHVTAVSGLHLTFAVFLFNYFFLLAGVSYRIRYLLGIVVAIFFTVLVGFPLSCVRACVMLIIFSVGMAVDEFADGLTSLSVAAFIIVLAQPLAVRDVGFLLSVLATGGIIALRAPIEKFLFLPRISKRGPHLNSIYRAVTGTVSGSVAVTITTLPVTLFVFGSVSLIAPVVNAVLIYPIQLFFMLGIFMVLFGFIPFVGKALGFLADLLYIVIEFIAELFGRLPFASVSTLDFWGVMAFVLFGGIVGISLYHYLKHNRRSFIALFAAFLCFCGMYSGLYAYAHQDEPLEIGFIDVGQGDCTVLSKDHRAVVLDYGGSSADRYHLIEYFRRKNIYSVELLAFTHLHDDHTNGLATLLGNVYVDRILYPDLNCDSPVIYAMILGQNSYKISDNTALTVLDDVTITPISDAVGDPMLASDNERCVCYRVDYGSVSVLVTGDMEAKTEMKLLPQMKDCTLLKVAHHGSDSSSMYPFLKAVSPDIAVISVGENSYGLPDESVVERLKTICPDVYNTHTDGSVVFRTNGTVLERIFL